MANEEHVKWLKQGIESWNDLRRENVFIPDFLNADLKNFDLSYADLRGAELARADLTQAQLSGADLSGARIQDARLFQAELVGTNLYQAYLLRSDLSEANLQDANLYNAFLARADLYYANLTAAYLVQADLRFAQLVQTELLETNLTEAHLLETVFVDVNLSRVIGLASCNCTGHSTLDYRTLENSGPLPQAFLRGIGLPDVFIDYLPSLLNSAVQHYSSFISFSTKDQSFADRLYADLQNHGIRCWFAPHDMPIGGKILDEIDSAIRLRDKVLLILSEHSIESDWVEDEVTKAFEEERKRGQTVLFPIRLDDAVMDTDEAWAAKLRARHIGDFTRWKEHDEYQKSFARVLRDLTVKKP